MRYILLMDKSCICWLGKYLMIYRVLTTPSGAGLADINSMGPNGKIFTETTATQTCKSFQKGARPNSYKHHFDISSTNRPPRSWLLLTLKEDKKVNNLEHVPNRFQLAFPLGPSVTWQKGALNIGMMSASKNPEKSKEWCIQTGKYKESTHDESLGIFLQMDLKEIHSLNARYLLHFASGISAHQWKLAVL